MGRHKLSYSPAILRKNVKLLDFRDNYVAAITLTGKLCICVESQCAGVQYKTNRMSLAYIQTCTASYKDRDKTRVLYHKHIDLKILART